MKTDWQLIAMMLTGVLTGALIGFGLILTGLI